LLFELSLALPAQAAFQAVCAKPLASAAAALDAYAFLCLRSGADFVCAANAGSATVKALEHDVGLRRPLLVSAGGLAIVVALPAEEAAQVVEDNLRRVRAAGEVRAKAVERMLRRSQSHGYGIHLSDVVPGVNTYAAPIRDAGGVAFASISVAGRAEDLPFASLSAITRALDDAARAIGAEARRLLEL
jgi:DNA-binding IclR family transcriptional regulator